MATQKHTQPANNTQATEEAALPVHCILCGPLVLEIHFAKDLDSETLSAYKRHIIDAASAISESVRLAVKATGCYELALRNLKAIDVLTNLHTAIDDELDLRGDA